MTIMRYKGYEAAVDYDEEAEIFHGEVANLRDVITFQGASAAELKQALADSIEDYLAFCAERGEEPEKPFSGQFMVRADPGLHKAVANAARRDGVSLNKWVTKALEKALS
jgi:predicted HicB family RNase H-like nuclease